MNTLQTCSQKYIASRYAYHILGLQTDKNQQNTMDLDEAENVECVSSKQGKGVKYFFRLQAVLRKNHKRI